MGKYDALVELLLDVIKDPAEFKAKDAAIPVGISNRHIHLSQVDLNTLFGAGYMLTKIKELSQPQQYACKETVILCGPNGAIENVRILGPTRSETQVEILQADCYKLGVKAPVRQSGELQGTPGITLVGPKGSIQLNKGLIIAQRHIHMSVADAKRFGVSDGEKVSIQINNLRGGAYSNVIIRANNNSTLECHVDTEEANAMGLTANSQVMIFK